jgi:hypothetical protein
MKWLGMQAATILSAVEDRMVLQVSSETLHRSIILCSIVSLQLSISFLPFTFSLERKSNKKIKRVRCGIVLHAKCPLTNSRLVQSCIGSA